MRKNTQMYFDLHVHTSISACSRLTPAEILRHARSVGLDGVCITDHDTMTARHLIREGLQPDGLCIIIGMEYTTPAGDFLLFGPFENLPSGLQARELLNRVGQSGGVAIAAHPFREDRATDEKLIAAGLCGIIEGVNGRNGRRENEKVRLWQERYGVRQVGGSDAHDLLELGNVTTLFSSPITDRKTLIDALREGLFSIPPLP